MRVISQVVFSFLLALSSATVGHAAFETYVDVGAPNRITNADNNDWSNASNCSLGDVVALVSNSGGLDLIRCFHYDSAPAERAHAALQLLNSPRGDFNYRIELLTKVPGISVSQFRMIRLYSPVGLNGSVYIPSGVLREGLHADIPLIAEFQLARMSLNAEEMKRARELSETEMLAHLQKNSPSVHKVLGVISTVDLGTHAYVVLANAEVQATKDSHRFKVRAQEVHLAESDFTKAQFSPDGISNLRSALKRQDTARFKSVLNEVAVLRETGLWFTPLSASK